MTRNQIEYAKLVETRRANRASEENERYRTSSNYQAAMSQVLENRRHNVIGESQNAQTLEETRRSNVAREQESLRSSLAKEAETMRSNMAKELEANRHNVQTEHQAAKQLEADVAYRSAVVAENLRSHLADESIRRGQLAETAVHNRATEVQARNQLAADYTIRSNQLAEAIRHNMQGEDVALQTLSATVRHNAEMERQGRDKLALEGINTSIKSAETDAKVRELDSKASLNQTSNFQKMADALASSLGKLGSFVGDAISIVGS